MMKLSATALVVLALCYVWFWGLPSPEFLEDSVVLPKDGPAIDVPQADNDNEKITSKASLPERELLESTARVTEGAALQTRKVKVRPSNNIPEVIMRADVLNMDLIVGCGEMNSMNVELDDRQQRDLQWALDRYGELRREHSRVRASFSEELRQAVAAAGSWRSIEKHPVGVMTPERIAAFEKRRNVKVRLVMGHASEEPFDRARYLKNLEIEKRGGRPEVVVRVTSVVPSEVLGDGNRYIPEITWFDRKSGREYYAQRRELPKTLDADLALCYRLERFSYEIVEMCIRFGACDGAAEGRTRARIAAIAERINRGVGPMSGRRRR